MTARIAFLGTGLMGAPMARNLLEAGYSLSAWNRTRAKAVPLESLGARIADSAPDAVTDADFVVSILENGPVVSEVLFGSGAFENIPEGALVIDMSSVAPHFAEDHARRLRSRGIGHLDAPVSGGPNGAVEKSLAIMVGGSEEDFARARPLFAHLGRATRVGPPGSGQFAKLCSQTVAAAAVTAVAEMMVLATAAGVDPARVREALKGGLADSKVLGIHGQRMLERDFVPGGHVRTFLKDLNAAHDIAGRERLDLPQAELTRNLFAAVSEHGSEDKDIAALLLELERRNPSVTVGNGGQRRA